jgi:hypothetical protein
VADRREAILARLVTLCGAVAGINAVGRNRTDVTQMARPAVVILDGSEELFNAPVHGRQGSRSQVQLMQLTPSIVIALRGNDGIEAGSLLSLYRTSIVGAILTDTTLAGAITTNGGIRYEGCSVTAPGAEAQEHQIELSVVFVYPFQLSDLAA